MDRQTRPILKRVSLLALALSLGLALGYARTGGVAAAPRQAGDCSLIKFDLNADKQLTPEDGRVWLNWYRATDMRADLNGNGTLEALPDFEPLIKAVKACGWVHPEGPKPVKLSNVKPLPSTDNSKNSTLDAAPLRSGGPDDFGYSFTDSIDDPEGCAAAFVDIRNEPGVKELFNAEQFFGFDDVAIGFDYPFYGNVQTNTQVSSQGYLTFGGDPVNFFNTCSLPDFGGSGSTSAIYGVWTLLDSGGQIHGGTMDPCPGGRPSPCFAAQWTDVPYFFSGGATTFEIFLYPDASSEIQFERADDVGFSTTTGMQNGDATIGLTYGACEDYLSSLPLAVCFSAPDPTTADLAVSKTGLPDPVDAGKNLTYTIDIRNNGPATAQNVVMVDTLPTSTPLVTVLSAALPGGSCVVTFPTVTCRLASLAPFTSAVATIVVSVPLTRVSSIAPCEGPPLVNTARVSNDVRDPNPDNDATTISTEVQAGSDVTISLPVIEFFDRWQGDEDPGVECIAAGDTLQITQSFSNNGPEAINTQLNNAGDEFFAKMPAATIGIPNSCTQTLTLAAAGTCIVNESSVRWNGTIPVGARVTLRYRVRVRGALLSGTLIDFTGRVNYDDCNNAVNTAFRTDSATVALNCPGIADPNRQLWKQVHLPILNFQGQDDVCRTWIEVQNVGDDFAKAVLVTWGEPGFCPPQCAGPLKVECTGLLKPGSTWNLLGAQIPTGSKGGMLFKFSAKQVSELFPGNGGDDDIVADAMCEDLFFGVVGDCDDYRRFKKAYNEALDWGPRGLNMGIASGGGFLAVDVLRHCPGDVTPGVEVSSKYNGIAAAHLGTFDPVYGGYGFYVPLLYADKAGFNSIMYIQNGGLECSSIEIWFKAQDDCLRAKICEIFTLAPGETYQFDASDCVGPDWQGSAWLRSTQPLGIVVDIIGRDVLMSYMGEPAELRFALDGSPAAFSQGDRVAYGPLMYSEYQGWDTGVQVQNLSAIHPAKVKAYFLDRGGDIITTLVDWICPRGSQTFFLPVITDLPGNWVGSIRVESQEWWTPGSDAVRAGNIVAVAQLIKYNDAARTQAIEAIAYNLLPEHKAYDWQIGFGGGGTDSGVGLIAIPSLLRDLEGTGLTSEVAIANLVPKPGFTDFAIFIYDQNGLLDFVCQKLNEKQVEYINLQTWGYVSPGFKGSAIISATFWEHDVFDDTGFFLRNLLGLGAVSVERTGTRLGEDVPGDEAAGERGIPFAENRRFQFDFEGPNAPTCPGQPIDPPQPSGPCGGCPPTLITGALTASDPTLTSTTCTQQVAGRHFYDAYEYTLCSDTRQTLTVSMCSLGGSSNYDAYLLLYQPFFDPTDPCKNLVAQDDDACAGGGGSRIIQLINPGPFEIVVSSWATAAQGNYTLGISLACTPD